MKKLGGAVYKEKIGGKDVFWLITGKMNRTENGLTINLIPVDKDKNIIEGAEHKTISEKEYYEWLSDENLTVTGFKF